MSPLFKICACALALIAACGEAQSATELYYTSAPQSWVGGGATLAVLPADGFSFNASRGFDNGVAFAINDFASNPNFQYTQWWYLQFSAPFGAPLAVGEYQGATRWPFQAAGVPGLSFSGNGRGDNQLTGSFSVLDVGYGADGAVLSFAADFVQYDEGIQAWWNRGSIRFNSDVPIAAAVPEPSTLMLMVAGMAGVTTLARRRHQKLEATALA